MRRNPVLSACACACLIACGAAGSAPVAGHGNGGRVPPVHRLVPVDAEGDPVVATASRPRPFSQERTCGQCHDVGSMRGGSHFRTGLDTNDAPACANREPWFLVDGRSQKVRALAFDGRPGTVTPAAAGLTAWQFAKEFGRAFPGGGVASDPRAMDEAGGARSRWFVTGPLEMNCLACHQRDGLYDASEWAKQVLRENWGAAAAAASGLARVEGMNARMDAAWDGKVQRENPDDHLFKVPETTVYDQRRFDDKNRVVFPVGRPRDENCLACHSVAAVGVPRHAVAGDVHLARGMSCVDCHRNGMDHRMKAVSCAECHFGDGGAGPKPVHAGLPLVHFERLDCAVCHSGVTPDGRRGQVRTARANRIGIYGKARWETDLPFVEEPFFVKENGRVTIRRRATVDGTNAVSWAFAHDVRPARRARGAGAAKCGECHACGSEFFADWENPVYFGAFNLAFAVRPVFKIALWGAFGLFVLFAAGWAACALNRLAAWAETAAARAAPVRWLRAFAAFATLASMLLLAAGGAIGFASGGMTGWPLMLHMCAGGTFAAAAVAAFALRGPARSGAEAAAGLALAVLAAGTVFTAVAPMMGAFGTHGQLVFLWAHRFAAGAFVLACLTGWRAFRAR